MLAVVDDPLHRQMYRQSAPTYQCDELLNLGRAAKPFAVQAVDRCSASFRIVLDICADEKIQITSHPYRDFVTLALIAN
jgi:hypothetical protein